MKKAVSFVFCFVLLLMIFACQMNVQTGQPNSLTENQQSFLALNRSVLQTAPDPSMVSIKGGSFILTDGTHSSTQTIADFKLSRYEVTYNLWYKVYQWAIQHGYKFANPGQEGSNGTPGALPLSRNQPVTTISWLDAVTWCNAYSEMEGYHPCYKLISYGDATYNDSYDGYRLPTEGEWQYAATNGGKTPYNYASGATKSYTDLSEDALVAWFTKNSSNTTHDVGIKRPNGLGIYDMSGNVWEFCFDRFESSSLNFKRITKGGSFASLADKLQTGYRDPAFASVYPDEICSNRGFRLAMSITQLPPLTFTPPSGYYTHQQIITISSTIPGATIKYTIDGSDPRTSPTAQTGTTVNLNVSMTIKAYAYSTEMVSEGVNATYTTPWTIEWTKILGAPNAHVESQGIAIDPAGNIYCGGMTDRSLDNQPLTGRLNLFIVKYNTNGEKQWTRLLGAPENDTNVNGIAADSRGNVYATGYTFGNLDGQRLTGNRDLFVVKYDTNGVKQWTRLLGSPGNDTDSNGIAIDPDGNIYCAGSTNRNLDGQVITGSTDLFVVKYNTNGVKQWTRLLGAPNADTAASGITTDSSGNIYATGGTSGNLGGEKLTTAHDAFIVKYNFKGERQWIKLFSFNGKTASGKKILVDAMGNIYATGISSEQSITSFIMKLNAKGEKQWEKIVNANEMSISNPCGLALDPEGNAYTTGYTVEDMDGQIRTGIFDLFIKKYLPTGEKQWTKLYAGSRDDRIFPSAIAIDSKNKIYSTGTTTFLNGQKATGRTDSYIIKFSYIEPVHP